MKYSIGDMVYNKDYGVGHVSQIDEKSRDFTYLVKFKGHAAHGQIPTDKALAESF